MNFFTSKEISPGIFHIGEPAGVHCTLLLGSERALLFDTGYGFCDIHSFVTTLTELPLTVVNSHGHLDHVPAERIFAGIRRNPCENT